MQSMAEESNNIPNVVRGLHWKRWENEVLTNFGWVEPGKMMTRGTAYKHCTVINKVFSTRVQAINSETTVYI